MESDLCEEDEDVSFSGSNSNSKNHREVAKLLKDSTPGNCCTKKKASVIGLELTPDPPAFGVLCAGHTFKIAIAIMNIGKKPDRFRVSCEPNPSNENKITCNYAPIRLGI